MADTTFEVGEIVLAEHQVLIYEAKILAIENIKQEHTTEEQTLYHVHYLRWPSKWDEWVPGTRLLKKTDANWLMKKAMDEQRRTSKKKRRMSHEGTKRSKGNRDATLADVPFLVNISFESLRLALIHDWGRVTQQNILEKLPRKPSVAQILRQYAESRQPGSKNPYDEMAAGLRELFDTVLSTRLLYNQERGQFESHPSKDSGKRPSDVYGGEHLLRLLVKMPEFLQSAQFSAAGFGTTQRELLDEEMESLQSFLDLHAKKMFIQ